MGSWVEAILGFLRQFWPFLIVKEFERGVPYLFGQLLEKETWWCYGGNLTPRCYLYIPFFMEIEAVPVKPDVLKLWNINVSTKDDKPIRLRANVRYEIPDAIKAWNEVQDYKDNLGDEARTHIASVVRDRDYSELLHDQGKIERECKNEMNAVVKEWGIKVIRVGITDFTRTRDISLANV